MGRIARAALWDDVAVLRDGNAVVYFYTHPLASEMDKRG